MDPSEGFAPIARHDARILVLGSLPGQRSLGALEYYAHPQNAFWKVMSEIHGVTGSYQERCQMLMDAGVAVWDVLKSSHRPGSLDADIQLDSAIANDFVTFLSKHTRIARIVFNGRKAEQLFNRFVELPDDREITFQGLPSTSPAYASMPFSGKLEAWRDGLLA